VTSSWPVAPDHMTLPVALIAVMSVISIVLVTIIYMNAFVHDYLNKVSSVRLSLTSIRKYLDV